MSEIFEIQETKIAKTHSSNFVVIGLLVTFIAFSLSVSSPWILDYFNPPPPVSEEIAEDEVSSGISQWLYSFIVSDDEREEKSSDIPSEKLQETQLHWTDSLPYVVLVIAFGGMLSATIGLFQSQNLYIGWTSIFLGSSAIMMQYILLTLAILAVIVVFVFLLSAIGVDF